MAFPNIENNNSFKNVVAIWWIFFWRYSIIFSLMLLINGFISNKVGKSINFPSFMLWSNIGGNFLINIVASFTILYSIIGKKIGGFNYLLVPSNSCSPKMKKIPPTITHFDIISSWWSYFWRFILFAFIIAFALAVVVASIIKKMGYNLQEFSRYTDYIGNISVIPASLAVFFLLICSKEGKRKLELISV